MNIDKLKTYLETSNTLANYKKVCEELDEKVLTGNAKLSQLKELERYFKFHKQGNKFVFTEIYLEPKDKIDGRKDTKGNNNVYGKYIYRTISIRFTCTKISNYKRKKNIFK